MATISTLAQVLKTPNTVPGLIQFSLHLVRHSFECDKLNSILNTEIFFPPVSLKCASLQAAVKLWITAHLTCFSLL